MVFMGMVFIICLLLLSHIISFFIYVSIMKCIAPVFICMQHDTNICMRRIASVLNGQGTCRKRRNVLHVFIPVNQCFSPLSYPEMKLILNREVLTKNWSPCKPETDVWSKISKNTSIFNFRGLILIWMIPIISPLCF